MIDDQIEKIQALLETSESMRPETRAELLRLLEDLKKDLASPAPTSVFDGTLAGLRGSVDELESSHPEVVNLVNRLATTLSNMGI